MATDAERLRSMVGEDIAEGQTDADTLFTDVRIDEFLAEAENDLNVAAAAAWTEKAGKLATMVDIAEGASRRNMSDLHANALKMATHYQGIADSRSASGVGRVRIHRIVRNRG